MEFLKKVWAGWTKVVMFIGTVLAWTILTVFYFTVFAIWAIPQTIFGDRLDTKSKGENPTWLSRATEDLTLEDARRLG
ncbi:MAG: hypothetical protein AAF490_03210 [Chloroflexota bacterium]